MKKHRIGYFLWLHTGKLLRNKAVYLLSLLLMSVGLTLVFVMLSCYFTYVADMRNTVKNNNWNDIQIFSDWNERFYETRLRGYNNVTFNDAPRGSQPFAVDESALITAEDFLYAKQAYGDKFQIKASTAAWFSYDQVDYEMIFITKDFFEQLKPEIEHDSAFFLISRDVLPIIRQAISEDAWSVRQFPFGYDSKSGMFADFFGNPVAAYFIEDFDDSDLSFYTYQVYLSEDVPKENHIYIPFDAFFSVYAPIPIDLRVSSEEPALLADFMTYMNTAHKGRVGYGYKGLAAFLLERIYEQMTQFAILTPMIILVTIMVAVNFMGMQLLNQRRQQRDIAVQLACGAEPALLAGGMMYSALLTCLIAAFIATIVGTILVQSLHIVVNDVVMNPSPWAGIIVFGLAAVLGALSSIPSAMALGKLSPIELLSSEVEHA